MVKIAIGTYVDAIDVTIPLTLAGAYDESFQRVDVTATATTVQSPGNDRCLTLDGNGAAMPVTLELLRFTGGNAQTASPQARFGGGVLAFDGVALTADRIRIDGCVASSGAGTGFGGGLAVLNATAVLDRAEILDNAANVLDAVGQARGGGIYLAGLFGAGRANLTLTNSRIVGNVAQDSNSSAGSGGNDGYGGGLFVGGANQTNVVLQNNLWQDNAARRAKAGWGRWFGGVGGRVHEFCQPRRRATGGGLPVVAEVGQDRVSGDHGVAILDGERGEIHPLCLSGDIHGADRRDGRTFGPLRDFGGMVGGEGASRGA